jgi:iron complex outermembrane recepter protein
MKKIFTCFLVMGIIGIMQAQAQDTIKTIKMDEVVVTANRIPLTLSQNPGAFSLVAKPALSVMPRSIAVDEALRSVPGVRIDNQANGSRVHMSIRGQGILSERGLRGIKVLIDGIPVNDPTGFAPDLYDVDWATVQNVEVLRGPATSLYGGSANAGVMSITTQNGGEKPAGGTLYTSFGSNGFYKVLGQVNGSTGKLGYRVSFSHMKGNGYRYHQGFWGNNLSEKVTWRPNEKITISQVFLATTYFNQNAEGLNLSQLDDPKQANPDAIPCNEYQKTQRITNGITGRFELAESHHLSVTGFLRTSDYKEPGSSAVQYRDFMNPGASLQYEWDAGKGSVKNHFSAGAEIQYQRIDEIKLPNIKDTSRTEEMGEMDETVIEGTTLLANQTISQNSSGIFAVDRVELGKNLNMMVSVRYDNIRNELTDKLNGPVDLSGDADFQKTTARVGLSYRFSPLLTLYANWGQGFLPPATEELASNPDSYGGFNTSLEPATSAGEELGLRGSWDGKLFYDLTAFFLNTENDFYRYRILPDRPLETFYGNAGKTKRFGVETSADWIPVKDLLIRVAYTYSNFKYTETSQDSMYTMGEMLPAIVEGNYLPNSPMHQLFADVEYRFLNHFTVGVSTDYQSEWYIYSNLDVTQEGFNLWNARAAYDFRIGKVGAEISVYGKNLTDEFYMGFTEPDPDGNSYQPGPGREFFGSLRINL